MRKIIALLTITIMLFNLNGISKNSANKEVSFYGVEMSYDEQLYLTEHIQEIADLIAFTEGIDSGSMVSYGSPISVLGTNGNYFIPFYMKNEIKYLIVMSKDIDNSTFSLSFSKNNVDVIGNLKCGNYYIKNVGDNIYLLGDNGFCKNLSDKADNLEMPLYSVNDLRYAYRVENYKTRIIVNDISRGNLSKTLSVPYFANFSPGYCWLCSALSISYFFDPTLTVGMVTAHDYVHTDHTFSSCTGGNRWQAEDVIEHYTGLTGTNTTLKCTAPYAMTSITSDIPVYMSLTNPTSAHACVICGYILNNTTGSYTYIIMDPNYSSYQYQVTQYSDNIVNYTPSPSIWYVWVGALYDWH